MIRAALPSDLPTFKDIIDAAGLFPSEMLDEMMSPYLSGNQGGEIWLTSESGAPDGLLYCAPERMTDGTWNMLLIAVDPSLKRQGKGRELVRCLESALALRGARVLIVETSGLPEFEGTRHFYRDIGYAEEARVRDFYQAGEDKIVFWKSLA